MMAGLSFSDRLAALGTFADTLRGIQRGIEKESLRVDDRGQLARTPHPRALGSALTHPHITTDYSEALLELITPPVGDVESVIRWLTRLHRFVGHTLDAQAELVWNASMPCPLGEDKDIPVADYGSSNVGRMKHIYRLGLGHRYGRHMQTIAGIHYNLSFPDAFWEAYQPVLGDKRLLDEFISTQYFGLLRNFQRNAWLLIYLFGASPAACDNFLASRSHPLLERYQSTLMRPYATSLRMSDIGYQNNVQSGLQVSLDDLDSYVNTLTYAISTSEPSYEKIGLRDALGHYLQLNTHILQIENEFYSSIRPKRTTHRNERPTLALQRRGVEYIEIRSIDINPFEPVGISATDCRFLDLFATWCLLTPSPVLSHCDMNAAKQNIRQVVYDGRRADLRLWRCRDAIPLKAWGRELMDEMDGIAGLFDRAHGGDLYRQSLDAQRAKIEQPETLPSARVLAAIRQAGGHAEFVLSRSRQLRDDFLATPVGADDAAFFATAATTSLASQRALEADTSTPFETYVAHYFQGLD